MSVLESTEQLYRNGHYGDVITTVRAEEPFGPLPARLSALIGISLLRLGDAEAAAVPLQAAMDAGDQEAAVEYGNLLRAVGRFQEAEAFLLEQLEHLDPVHQLTAQRWLGVAMYQQGKNREGLKILEKVQRGYLKCGDTLGAAKVRQNLSVIYHNLGDVRRASQTLEDALAVFRQFGAKNLLIINLRNAIELKIILNRLDTVTDMVVELESLLGEGASVQHVHLYITKVLLADQLSLGQVEYVRLLDLIIETSEQFTYHENLVWGIVKKLEYLLSVDRTSDAMRLVYRSPQDSYGQFPFQIRVVRAMINRRMGNYPEAIEELSAIAQDLEDAENIAELSRVRLQLAFALHLSDQPDRAAEVLKAALQGLLRTNIHASMRPELEELSELLHFASMQPSLAPYLEPVMDTLAGVLSGPGSREDGPARLQVYTLGQVTMLLDGTPISSQLKGMVPLLVFLALTPNRTMHEILLELYPDKDPAVATGYVRNCIKELRLALGQGAVLTEGPSRQSRYRISPTLQLDLDLSRYIDAVNQGEIARALSIYRGDFLPGTDDSQWVTEKREAARMALTFELHTQIVVFREQREWRRVILLSNQYLRVDPNDLEVHEMRIDAARRVGTASELGRFVAAMQTSSN